MVAWVAWLGVTAIDAQAHVTSTSLSHVLVDGANVDYRLDLNPVDVAMAIGLIQDAGDPLPAELLEANQAPIAEYLEMRVTVYGDGAFCEPGPVRIETAGLPERLRAGLTFTCPSAPRKLLIQYMVFFELDAHHVSIGRLESGGVKADFLLSADNSEFEAELTSLAERGWAQAGRFLLLGVEHILIGYDHILFLIGLIVASLRFRYLISVVTMFTLAHTITLLLAALGYVALPGRLVESVIALSIAYIALENLMGWGMRYRWAITFGFGLVHGLGFASVLAELAGEQEIAVGSLFAFNAGVEVGQLAIVCVVYPLLLLMARFKLQVRVMQVTSAVILVVALFWFGERAFAW